MNESEPRKADLPVPLEYRGRPDAAANEMPERKTWPTVLKLGCLVLALLAIAAVVLLPTQRHRYDDGLRPKCSSNLKNIAACCITYANTHNGNYPDTVEELFLDSGVTPSVFVCPATNDTEAPGATQQEKAAALSTGGHCSYIYLGKGLTGSSPDNTVLAYEPLANHKNTGMHVLYNDYRVDWLDAKEGQKLINSIVAGRPTVWPPATSKQ